MLGIHEAISELKSVRIPLRKPQMLPDDVLLDDYQAEVGVVFPKEYRTFLKEASDSIYNGKDALQVTATRNSPRELLVFVLEARERGVSPAWLPICEDNGNYYCLLSDGRVKYWSHDGACDEEWPNLASWIKNVWIDGE